MAWNEGLLPEQETAAGHAGSHARLLAGPGTGKTHVLSRRAVYLVEELNVEPAEIVALTFTRAAAHELRERVGARLGEDNLPRISTLHSFALRQLLRNAWRLDRLPQPLRIADDWEERYLILEDLKAVLAYDRIERARERFSQLAADWQTLAADQGDFTPDPAFIAAWREHRELYGYTLRNELVYQLKRALEELVDFDLETPIRHLLVDEYQDLNRCDLAVIRAIADQGAEVYVAGDDDQSIYGFRKAHPDGIRQFPEQYVGARDLLLELCMRCDEEILEIAQFVAQLDPRRIPKVLRTQGDRIGGEVALLRFADQYREAPAIAAVCRALLDAGHPPDEILILLRSDRHRSFSKLLVQRLESRDVPVATSSGGSPLDEAGGEQVLAFLRLLATRDDHLAWRTLIQQRANRLGAQTIASIIARCRESGERFASGLRRIADDPTQLDRFGLAVQAEVRTIGRILDEIGGRLSTEDSESADLADAIRLLGNAALQEEGYAELRGRIIEYLSSVAEESEATTIGELLGALATSNEMIEQTRQEGKVNILTMHQAKGLTAETVLIVGVEDERLPGRATSEADIGDERRLLFVSLTRAKHRLFVTYCNNRRGRQQNFGRVTDRPQRTLTRFLQDGPLRPVDGNDFAYNYVPRSRR